MLQDLGMYPSRSEAIRVAIRDFLMDEYDVDLHDPGNCLDAPDDAGNNPPNSKVLLQNIRNIKEKMRTIELADKTAPR